ncbi:MAG: propionyl-coenzyme A carboxylase alpha polypeptide [Mesorhizobium sp.]|nr:MAG: propionyl-coenzyme A carboxylase alpha polypeptide [Mesorhizobium sp.]
MAVLRGALDVPRRPCRRGGVHGCEGKIRGCRHAPSAKLPISPLAGEMPGRAEGGGKDRQLSISAIPNRKQV